MAVAFIQEPTSPNGSQSTIIYVTDNISVSPQAKYICDVKISGSYDTLVRIKQPANNSGFGVFELSEILHDYTDYDNEWTTDSIIASTNDNTKTFSIEFGEEYGTSISSSLTVNPSQITSSLVVYPAVTELTEGFNWNSGSYYSDFLSNSPSTLYIKPSEYSTVSHMNILDSNPSGVTVTVYDSSDSQLATKTLTNSIATGSEESKLIHIPSGPQNFKDDATLNILTGSTWEYYTVTANSSLGSKTYYRLDDCISQNGTHFAFINKLGVYDYYTATLTKTEQENYNTETYEQTFIDFSTTTGAINFDKSRRGTTIYNKTTDVLYSAQTDWLTTTQADWLMELFQSPSVYIQDGDNFLPVIITNSTVDKKTNPRGQKLFTFRIEYKLANPRKARR